MLAGLEECAGGGCGAGLIDFGQSKQLTEAERLAFARLVLALSAAEGAELLEVLLLRVLCLCRVQYLTVHCRTRPNVAVYSCNTEVPLSSESYGDYLRCSEKPMQSCHKHDAGKEGGCLWVYSKQP